jgi:hypothetical protein
MTPAWSDAPIVSNPIAEPATGPMSQSEQRRIGVRTKAGRCSRALPPCENACLPRAIPSLAGRLWPLGLMQADDLPISLAVLGILIIGLTP